MCKKQSEFSNKLMFQRFDGKININENIITTLKVRSDDSLKDSLKLLILLLNYIANSVMFGLKSFIQSYTCNSTYRVQIVTIFTSA